MDYSSDIVSQVLLQSLIEGPLLLGNLPEATTFDHQTLTLPQETISLNLQQKLGHLYEDSLTLLLENTPRYHLLTRGLQIREKSGRTLGELDFLLRDHISKQLIHLELAVKFYLAVESEGSLLLPGPDARDNYFRKLEKMRSHQLLLTKKHLTLLPDEFRKEEIIVQQLVYGCIFNHVNAHQPIKAEFLNPNGRRGKWLHASECQSYFGETTQLEIIPKPLWPSPLEILEGIELEKWQPGKTIKRCTMVRANTETLPYFIAPDDYPATTEP